MGNGQEIQGDPPGIRSLVVVYSYHHGNTEKVARAIADVLGAPVKTPQQVDPGEVTEFDLVGFGSGIYSARHHESLLDLADRIQPGNGRKAFLFSTFGAPAGLFRGERLQEFTGNNHAALRERLESRGFTILGEFACPGWNTNSFLRFFGGLNGGRPDEGDLAEAAEFARRMGRLAGTGDKGGNQA